MPARKLGVNKGEDAMFAAHRFLDAEGIPTSTAYVEQITEWIENQVGGFTLGGSSAPTGGGPVDPVRHGLQPLQSLWRIPTVAVSEHVFGRAAALRRRRVRPGLERPERHG